MAQIEGPDCWNCGQDKDFQIDGYSFGDRLLEDVMFTVTFKDGKVEVAYPNWESDPYMSGINTPYWCELIQESITSKPEVYDEYLYCPHCNNWMA
jgi:hypothetical protein